MHLRDAGAFLGVKHLVAQLKFAAAVDHDGHEPSNLTNASSWLTAHLKPLLEDRRFTDGLVLILTFDEDDSATNRNRVYTVIWGDHVKIGTSSDVYDHEDLLATISALLGVEPPPFDEKDVRPIGGVWK